MRKILAFGLIVVAVSLCFADKDEEDVKKYAVHVPDQIDPGFALKPMSDFEKFTSKPDPGFTLRPPRDTEEYNVPVTPLSFDPTKDIPTQVDPGFYRKPPYDISNFEKLTSMPEREFTLRLPRDTKKYNVPLRPFSFDPTKDIPTQVDPGFYRKPPYDIPNFEKLTSMPDREFMLRPPRDTEKYNVPLRSFSLDPGFYPKPPYDMSNFENFTSKPDPGFTLIPPRDITSSNEFKNEDMKRKYDIPLKPWDPMGQLDPGFVRRPQYDIFENFTSKPDPEFTLIPPY